MVIITYFTSRKFKNQLVLLSVHWLDTGRRRILHVSLYKQSVFDYLILGIYPIRVPIHYSRLYVLDVLVLKFLI